MTSRKKSNSVTVGREMSKVEWEAVFVPGLLLKRSPQTVKDIQGCLGNFGRRMEEGYGLTSITQITRDLVELYLAELAGLSVRSISRHAAALRILCRMMGVPEMVPSNSELGYVLSRQQHKEPASTEAGNGQ